MMLGSLDPDEQRTIYAGAFLLWRRAEEDWSPPPLSEPGCGCARCAPVKPAPHRGTEAWRADMHHRHRLRRRGKR